MKLLWYLLQAAFCPTTAAKAINAETEVYHADSDGRSNGGLEA